MVESLPGALLAAFERQPYLGTSLLILGFGLAWLGLSPARPRAALSVAAAAAPFGLFEYVFYVPEYWTPVQWRLAWVGLGDLVFTFAAGLMAWLLATAPLGGRLAVSWARRRMARRFLGCTAIGLVLAVVIWRAGLPMYLASLVAMWIGWGCVTWRNPNLRWLGLLGAPAFALVYLIALASAFELVPDFHRQWNWATLSGATLAGVPVEELWWAATFGAVWPSFMAYVLDARPVRASASASR